MDELRALRKIVEQHLAGYAWGEFSRQNPARSELLRQLLDVGFSPRLADHWLGQVRPDETAGEALGQVKAAVERGLATLGPEDDVIERGGVFALVGPTGVGKTTTTAKLAARCVLRHGREKVALITTDGYRIGAHEQLRIYGRILGVPVHAVKNAAELQATLRELAGKHLVLIDTMGMSQRDRNVVEQTRMFDGCQVERLLLLPATARGDTLDDVIAAYGGATLSGCVITKIDEAVSLAPALDAVIRHRLAVAFVCNGQRVPEDLHLPNRAYLVHRAFKDAGEQSPHRSRGVEPAVMMASAGYFPAQARA
jgi:flagellar biosynthesis protein FlhF